MVVSELLRWSVVVKTSFVFNNINELSTEAIIKNLPKDQLEAKFVGIHTFRDTLIKVISGKNIMINEISCIRQELNIFSAEMKHTTANLLNEILGLRKMLETSSPATAEMVPAPPTPATMQTEQKHTWPTNLNSLSGIKSTTVAFGRMIYRL